MKLLGLLPPIEV